MGTQLFADVSEMNTTFVVRTWLQRFGWLGEFFWDRLGSATACAWSDICKIKINKKSCQCLPVCCNSTSYKLHCVHCSGTSQNLLVLCVCLQMYKNGSEVTHYQCQKCFKVYTSPYLISDHMRITNEGQLSCQTFCPSGRKLKRKTVSFVFDAEHCFVRLCQYCGKSFTSSQALYNHSRRCKHQNSNQKAVNKFTCDVCGYSVGNCRDLLRHKEVHNPKRTKAYVCDTCGNAYFSRRGLDLHRNSVHFRTEVFPCPTCSKVFYSTVTQRRHIKTHTGDHSHACKVCGKAFTTRYNLKVHERIHSGDKPYRCSRCKTQFAQKNSLNFHMRSCAKSCAIINSGSINTKFLTEKNGLDGKFCWKWKLSITWQTRICVGEGVGFSRLFMHRALHCVVILHLQFWPVIHRIWQAMWRSLYYWCRQFATEWLFQGLIFFFF